MVVIKIALLLCCATAILGSKIDLDNISCTTLGARNNWAQIWPGKEGLWASTEIIGPITLTGETTKLKSTFKDATLTGMKDCTVKVLSINTDDMTMDWIFNCPRLDVQAELFQLDGCIGKICLKGEGHATASRHNVDIVVSTNYVLNGNNKGEQYMKVIAYKVEFNRYGELVCDFVFDNDKETSTKATKYFNNNPKIVESEVCDDTLRGFVASCMTSVQDFMSLKTVEELFPQCK